MERIRSRADRPPAGEALAGRFHPSVFPLDALAGRFHPSVFPPDAL